MSRKYAALFAFVLVCVLSTPALAYLRIHPDNPHYFQETSTGRPVLIASVGSIVPSDTNFDYTADIAQMGQRRISYARVWHFLPWAGSTAIWPWARSSTPNAPMGGNKIDMNSWNSTYWTRLTDSLSKANTVGTYAEIHLFERCGLSPSDETRYQGNPWAGDNNINSLGMPTAVGNDGTPEFYQWSSKPNLKYQQERYIKKMIDETIAYPNAFYEIENEHWQSDSSGWADHYGQFVKDYIAANYPNSPRLTSYSSIETEADLDQCYTMPAIDIVNQHYGSDLEDDPSIVNPYIQDRWGYNKPINIDEFANGVTDPNILRQECWTIISSGGHFSISDATPPAKPFDLCENIRSFLAMSGWDFIHAAPNKSLITSGGGYCMAQPGVEYFCYFPAGGSKTITLAAGTYRAEWWNPRTGGFSSVSNFTHGGGSKTLASPDANDWALHVTTKANPTMVLQSKTASTALTINGSSSDWNLSEFTSKIAGGSAGTGQIGVVGYDSNGVCHTGGHATNLQYSPTNAADHAVKIYSRNAASYLYFLVRVDDSDLQYADATPSNNDCVEFYIDPGNDHGAGAMANSTSDFRLVIDANNRTDVLGTTSTYRTAVLAGVSSSVMRDASGWWLEVRIIKSVTSPVIPAVGTIGVDFNFRDNDANNSAAQSSSYTWADPETSTSFPTAIPARWGDLSLQADWNTLGAQLEVGNGQTPGVAVDSQGSIHVVYGGGGNIYYRKVTPDLVLGAIEQIPNPVGPGDYTCFNVVCDSNNVPHVVFERGWYSDDQRSWYTNKIGGSWKTPIVTIDNTAFGARTNYPRLCLSGGYAFVSVFSCRGDFGREGTLARVTNLSGTPVADKVVGTMLWVPHIMAATDGRIFVSGRYGPEGYQYQQYDQNLNEVGDLRLMSTGLPSYPGEENGASIDSSNVIHWAGAINMNDSGTSHGHICYNSSARLDQGKNSLNGLVGSRIWDEIQVFPTVTTDPALKTYISYWNDPTAEGKVTVVQGDAYATPVTFASAVTQHIRWNPQIAPTPAGGVYAAWDYAGKSYIRGIGVGSYSIGVGAPGPVTSFTAGPRDGQVNLRWTNPSDASFTGTMIRYKTTGYPTNATDGTQLVDKIGPPGGSDSHTHTGLTNGITYYYSAFARDGQSNYSVRADASATPVLGATVTLNSKPAGTISIDGSSADWALTDFTSKVRGGVELSGDYAIVGYDGGSLYYAGYWTDASLPTNAADHSAKVYSRHDATHQYFLIRCDDDQINYAQPVSGNWANDCVEFYIDPGHDHGATALVHPGTTTSDVQLVIDSYSPTIGVPSTPRVNVYCVADAYRTQVLAGVTAAVVRDATGWWLEVRITKSALNPDMPLYGVFGVDFAFRDNDNPTPAEYGGTPAQSTMYTWCDTAGPGYFPSKIPNSWANLNMSAPPDTTPPASTTSFVATRGDQQVSLSWHNPSDADFTGTMIRCNTGTYPTGPTDGTLLIDKANSPNTNDSYVHTGLTNGVTLYYSAFAHDVIPNYAVKVNANATPADTTAPGPATASSVVQGDQRNFLRWTNPTDGDFAGVKVLFKTTGFPTGPTDGTIAYQGTGASYIHTGGSGLTNGATYYYAVYACDEAPNYSSAAVCSSFPKFAAPADVKSEGDTTPRTVVTITASVVSAVFPGYFYVQCVGPTCGACGIKVNNTIGYEVKPAQSATVQGTITTEATGERCIDAIWIYSEDIPGMTKVDALGVPNRTLNCAGWNYDVGTGAGQQGAFEGVGTNNMGLLVSVWGKVTQREPGNYFYIDDGSGLLDTTTTLGTPNVGVRVKSNRTPGLYEMFTGVSSCFKDGSDRVRPCVLDVPTDVTPPAAVTSFVATPSTGQVNLTWVNPVTSDWTGTMIRFKTTGYPTGPTDGTPCYDGTGTSFNHTSLTNGATYYYCAYAYDAVPNYATGTQTSAIPAPPFAISNSAFDSGADGWAISTWRAHSDYEYGAVAWVAGGGNPSGCVQSSGSGTTDSNYSCVREGSELIKSVSTAGHSGVKVFYDLKVSALGGNFTGAGTTGCAVDHNLVDEQLTVFYSTNGGTSWIDAGYLTRSTLLASYQVFGTRSIDLTGVSACNDNANLALRFRWQFNQDTDNGWLDNIKVQVNY